MDKNNTDKLKNKLFKIKENPWIKLTKKEKAEVFSFCNGYLKFLNENKTERECVKTIEKLLKENNFKKIDNIKKLKPNDKVYYINRGKNIYAAIIGEEDLKHGFNIIGSHLDSPRLDLKPNPLYEDTEIAMLKTHYYGGIKKYQWVNIPLSMHGVIIKADGEKIKINIGEKDNDPIFTIADLLPHLAVDQEAKTLAEGIAGEELNIIIGATPIDNIDEAVKLNILNILNEKYGVVEEDFNSAEIEFTPAFKAKNLGFDKSMIAAYGHDDRVSAYTSINALINQKNPKKTCLCILADKEEIGSVGNTGMYSSIFEFFIDKILNKTTENTEGLKEKIFNNSKLLSADVTGAYNPTFAEVYEENNESYLGYGISILKYTGTDGKSGGSDASAELVGHVRNLFNKNKVAYQVSEMGKVDMGGGGTISYILANKGIDALDCGIPILSMHSPYEIASKFDIYTAYKAYNFFYKED